MAGSSTCVVPPANFIRPVGIKPTPYFSNPFSTIASVSMETADDVKRGLVSSIRREKGGGVFFIRPMAFHSPEGRGGWLEKSHPPCDADAPLSIFSPNSHPTFPMKFDDLLPAINPIIQRAVRNTEKMTGEQSRVFYIIRFLFLWSWRRKKRWFDPLEQRAKGAAGG